MNETPAPAADAAHEQRQALARAVRLLASAAGFADTLRQTLAACLPTVADFGFFDVVVAEGEVRRTVAAHQAPRIEALLAATRWAKQVHPELNLCALSTGQPALHPVTDDAWYRRIAANDAHLALLRDLAFRSMITVPVRYGDELLGALTLFMGASGRRHTEDDLAFASELALLAAPVVANARLVERYQRAESSRAELLAAERRARGEAEAARKRFELLAGAGSALADSLDTEDTLRAIAQAVVPAVADYCRIDLVDDRGVQQRRFSYHPDPQKAQRALDMARLLQVSRTAEGSMAWCIAHRRAYYGRFDRPPASNDAALRMFSDALGMGATYIVPLVARGRTIGGLRVTQAESGRDIGEADRVLVQELAQRAALALDNANAYAEAEQARCEAEAASRAKDEFLAMLGHELRNPLAPIVTALELMARRNPASHAEERRIIARQVAHLSRLIDDLLDVSRITQGKVELKREPVDMKTVVAHALEQTQPVFERRANPLALSLPQESTLVQGDAVRLTQVLCNLLINAAKFTPPDGRIALELRRAGGAVEVSVEDSGQGIAAPLLAKVFEVFVQGRQALDRQAGGLGLGLAIVRMLVEMHGGSVSAASDGEGRGSRFTVRLPALAAAAATPAPAAAPAAEAALLPDARVLIVDDNSDAAETLAELLRVVGCEVRCAGDAEGALALLAEYRPRLALLDIGLPGIDGYELAARLRADPRSCDTRLVALTGYGSDSDRDRARAFGTNFDEYLVKPVAPDRLFGVMQKLLSSAPR